jgi:hypothetical protein
MNKAVAHGVAPIHPKAMPVITTITSVVMVLW